MRQIEQIVIHCSATKPKMDIGLKEIKVWHTAKPPQGQGWSDVGYHFIIRRDGSREIGRPLDRAGSHVKNHNARTIGICLVGGIDDKGKSENNFTGPQFGELERLVRELLLQFPGAEVLGHRDFPAVAKDCPCFNVRDWFKMEFGS